jgi:hypothetical protein
MEPVVFFSHSPYRGDSCIHGAQDRCLRAARLESPSADVTGRLEALKVMSKASSSRWETQERLDFAERLLSKARNDSRLAVSLRSRRTNDPRTSTIGGQGDDG